MWLNPKQREEPYPRFDMHGLIGRNVDDTLVVERAQVLHGCRQLVLCSVGLSPLTSETPIASCHHLVGHSSETAGVKPEEGGDDVKSSWPLCLGLHTCYNGANRTMQDRKVEQIA